MVDQMGRICSKGVTFVWFKENALVNPCLEGLPKKNNKMNEGLMR